MLNVLLKNSKFCVSSTDNVPLIVCGTQSFFLILFNTALHMHIISVSFNADQNMMNAHLHMGLI